MYPSTIRYSQKARSPFRRATIFVTTTMARMMTIALQGRNVSYSFRNPRVALAASRDYSHDVEREQNGCSCAKAGGRALADHLVELRQVESVHILRPSRRRWQGHLPGRRADECEAGRQKSSQSLPLGQTLEDGSVSGVGAFGRRRSVDGNHLTRPSCLNRRAHTLLPRGPSASSHSTTKAPHRMQVFKREQEDALVLLEAKRRVASDGHINRERCRKGSFPPTSSAVPTERSFRLPNSASAAKDTLHPSAEVTAAICLGELAELGVASSLRNPSPKGSAAKWEGCKVRGSAGTVEKSSNGGKILPSAYEGEQARRKWA